MHRPFSEGGIPSVFPDAEDIEDLELLIRRGLLSVRHWQLIQPLALSKPAHFNLPKNSEDA